MRGGEHIQSRSHYRKCQPLPDPDPITTSSPALAPTLTQSNLPLFFRFTGSLHAFATECMKESTLQIERCRNTRKTTTAAEVQAVPGIHANSVQIGVVRIDKFEHIMAQLLLTVLRNYIGYNCS
ncbi:hypothetical protein J6590_021731 [Homalodisca vitripennis]|nr:hypothetical protein J6590_021731 [Homalodisca vitripennis]